MNFFDHKGLGNHLLQLCPKVVKHPVYIFHGATAPSGQGLPHYRGFTNTGTPQSVGLLWTRDQPDAETSTWPHTTSITERHPYPHPDSNPQFRKASCRNPRLRPRGHWDRPFRYLLANHSANTRVHNHKLWTTWLVHYLKKISTVWFTGVWFLAGAEILMFVKSLSLAQPLKLLSWGQSGRSLKSNV